LIVSLSLLEFINPSAMTAPGRWIGGGRTIIPEPDLEAFSRREDRFLGAVGAWHRLTLFQIHPGEMSIP
jgi:hypothetical protein